MGWQLERSLQLASEADSSVVFTLAYYTKDASQIDRLFRQSKLMRPKWDQMHGSETYGATTIAKALSKVTKQYVPKVKRFSTQRPLPPSPANATLPAIVIDNRQLSELTSQALDAVKRANSPPSVFVRSGGLVRVVHDEQDIPKIEPLDVARIRCRLTEVANFFTMRKSDGGYIPVGTNPPKTLAGTYWLNRTGIYQRWPAWRERRSFGRWNDLHDAWIRFGFAAGLLP